MLDLLLMRHSVNPDWSGYEPADEGNTWILCGAALKASNCPAPLHRQHQQLMASVYLTVLSRGDGNALDCQLERSHSQPEQSYSAKWQALATVWACCDTGQDN